MAGEVINPSLGITTQRVLQEFQRQEIETPGTRFPVCQICDPQGYLKGISTLYLPPASLNGLTVQSLFLIANVRMEGLAQCSIHEIGVILNVQQWNGGKKGICVPAGLKKNNGALSLYLEPNQVAPMLSVPREELYSWWSVNMWEMPSCVGLSNTLKNFVPEMV